MFDGSHFMWGMHWAGWLVWLVVLVGVVWLIVRSQGGGPSRDRGRATKESPLEILKRRYAAGELSTEEYEERKKRLQRTE